MIGLLTLKKNYEFQKVFKKGTWYGGDLLSIYVVPNHKKANYIGIAVSKKVSKSSVKRNRIRRLIKESYRNIEKNIQLGFDIVMVWKVSCPFEKATYYAINQDIKKCLKKAQLLDTEEDEDVK